MLEPNRSACDAASLCDKLEGVVLPLFHRNRDGFIDVMRQPLRSKFRLAIANPRAALRGGLLEGSS
jgi:hypothetical protein